MKNIADIDTTKQYGKLLLVAIAKLRSLGGYAFMTYDDILVYLQQEAEKI